MITFLAPPDKWAEAFSMVVKTPVDSTTYWAPAAPHWISAGFLLRRVEIWVGFLYFYFLTRFRTLFYTYIISISF
jgi:hypothetical protein